MNPIFLITYRERKKSFVSLSKSHRHGQLYTVLYCFIYLVASTRGSVLYWHGQLYTVLQYIYLVASIGESVLYWHGQLYTPYCYI